MNEIVQQIKFLRARLNQDVDISLLGDGEMPYALNILPESEDHAGVASNCLGTTQKTVYIPNTTFTNITVTKTVSPVKFTFLPASLPSVLEIEVLWNNALKHIYIPSAGYLDLDDFGEHVEDVVEASFKCEMFANCTSASYGLRFFIPATDSIEMRVRARDIGTFSPVANVSGAWYDAVMDVTYFWDTHNSLYQYVNYNDVIINIPTSILESTFSISNAFAIGNGRKRMLYWNVNGGDTRKINIYNALIKDHTINSVNSNVIKPPPFKDITVAAAATTTQEYINFDKWFQLLLRNKFDDKEKSVFGSFSQLIYPSYYSENSIGVHGKASSKEYDIHLTSETHDEWTEFDYAMRINDGNWSVAELSTSGRSGYTKRILGNERLTTLDVGEANKPFDYVPIRAGCQSIISNNRQLVADCTEGYPNVVIDAEMSWGYMSLMITDQNTPASFSDETNVNATTKRIYIRDTDVTYSHSITLLIRTSETYYVHLEDVYGMALADIVTYFVNYINNNIATVDSAITTASAGAGYVQITHGAGYVASKCLYFAAYQKVRCSKGGAKHYYGIVYYDQFGRCGGVNVSDGLSFDTPLYSTDFQQDIFITGGALVINSQPPDWAYYYKILYGGSDISWYQQFVVKQSEVIQTDEFVLAININNSVLECADLNESFNVSPYQFNKGDRLKILAYDNTYSESESWGTRYTVMWNSLATMIIDTEILYQDESFIYVNKPKYDVTATGYYLLVEIYRKSESKPIEYFETEFFGTISNPGTTSCYHNYPAKSLVGTNVNQDATQPMRCFIPGFEHVIYQTWSFYEDHVNSAYIGTPVSCWMTSESFSNYFPSKTKGLGRVNFHLPDANTLRRNILRISNIYIPNSDINGLSTFDYDAYQEVDESYGTITSVKLVGDVLKIIQEHKISSMYLGAEMGVDASGNQIMLRSDKLLTPPRYSATSFGSMHPESIVSHGGYLYGYDVVNSCVWRDTSGGTYEISNGMRSYFKEKTRTLLNSGIFKAYGAYDYQNELYLLTFIDRFTTANNETIGFYEPTESWYSFYSFIPEAYCSIPGDHIISFKNGYLYTHDSATRNTFYGTAYNSNVWVVGNQYPDIPKKWNSLVVNSNAVWNAGENTDIIVDSDAIEYTDPQNFTRHKGNMVSRLKEGQFRYNQGEYYAEFLRDGTTRSSTFSQEDLRNGRPLSGKTILIKLKNSLTSAVYLRGVRINAQST